MAIIATLRVSNMKASLDFYSRILDFTIAESDEDPVDPTFAVVERDGGYLILSSHRGDGEFGTALVVTTDDVDGLFRKFRERGLKTPGNPDAPTMVHEGPIDQTWGTRELYVDDPDQNTIRFTQGWGV